MQLTIIKLYLFLFKDTYHEYFSNEENNLEQFIDYWIFKRMSNMLEYSLQLLAL